MKADELLLWDKEELAYFLAENVAEAKNLVEALPRLEKITSVEASWLEDYIEQNWKLILASFDIEDLQDWVEEKEYEEEWENWKNECVVNDHEYAEYRNEEFCWSVIEMMMWFRDPYLVESYGYRSKFRKS